MANPAGTAGSPQFSVVIPTYNRAATVGRAIESVLKQTYPPAELIVVDDGSQDATRQYIDAYGDALRYIYQENAGASAARNRGAAEARFTWLAFLDSDDLWYPDYLEAIAGAITATAGAATLYFSDAEFEEFDPPRNRWSRVGFKPQEPYELLERPVDLVLAESQPMLLPFSVFRRSEFLASGGLWEPLSAGEDTHLFVRLGLDHSLCAVARVGGEVKGEPGSSGRLTGAFGPRSTKHWDCSVLLWKNILERSESLTPQDRQLIRRRIADAYWRKSMLSMKRFKLLAAAASLAHSVINDPSIAMETVSRRISRRA